MAKVVGLCAGKYNLPVDEYIFEGFLNLNDIEGINKHANRWVWEKCKPQSRAGVSLNQLDGTDVQVLSGEELIIYVTGPIVATAAVLSACAYNGVPVVLMHYNRDTNDYHQQVVFGRM